MFERSKIIDENFIDKVKMGLLPEAKSSLTPEDVSISKNLFLDLFESQMTSRHIDLQARLLKDKGLGFYTIGSSGHEGNVAIAEAFQATDMAFLHYRSSAFMLQRAKQAHQSDQLRAQLLSLVASKNDPISAGRHKVFGSLKLTVPPQTSTIASHLPKAVGAALSIGKAKHLGIKTYLLPSSVILCSFGDASVNHSTAQGAFNTAQWLSVAKLPLPIVFICEDNGLGISVPTQAHWIEAIMKNRVGMQYMFCEGVHLPDVYQKAKQAEAIARHQHQPVFLHMKTVRLMGHAGSDLEEQYRSLQEIQSDEFNDPLLHTARICMLSRFLTADDILQWYERIRVKVEYQASKAILTPKLTSAEEIMHSIIPKIKNPNKKNKINLNKRQEVFSEQFLQLHLKRNLSQQINFALMDILLEYPHSVVFGEDVAKKGGVYRVTADLMQHFGRSRVFDTLLDEQAILGTAMGLAHNGFLPIPEIQFLAYFHNAADQLRGEAATLSFFSNGQYANPMVIRIPSFAYQKGFGGHFHNDNSIAALRDIPGIIIACPSNGADAVRMLRRCVSMAHNEGRVIVFLEPIALYMQKDLHKTGDGGWLSIYPAPDEMMPFAELGIYGSGLDLVILSYGNGYYLARQAEQVLRESHNIAVKLVDLRWLAPLNKTAILQAVKDYKRILIIDECRQTGSISEALVTLLVEGLESRPEIKRISAEDSFIPLGTAWQSLLPSKENIISIVKNWFGN